MNTRAVPLPASRPLSTLRYRPRFGSVLDAVLLASVLIKAIIARFRLPQYPFIDNDFWGYFHPALSTLTGHGFTHTQGRGSLYPGFIYTVLRPGGDLRAISVVQHLLGIGPGNTTGGGSSTSKTCGRDVSCPHWLPWIIRPSTITD